MSVDPPTEGGHDDRFEDPADPFEGLAELAGLGGGGDDADPGERHGSGPFDGVPLFGDLMRMLGGAAPGASQARDVARAVATGGASEPNVDPADRIAVEQLMRVAELRVADATGLSPARGAPLRVEVTNRIGWSDRTLSDYGPLFDALSASVQGETTDEPDDPMAAMLSGLTKMIGPAMMTLTAGAMVGRLAEQALGGYALPVPRPPGAPLLIALPNVDEFSRQWSLDVDDVRLWVCLHEAVNAAVFGVDHLHRRLTDLLIQHAASFDSNPRHLEDLLGDFDPMSVGPEAFAELQTKLASPEAILGAVRSDTQRELLPVLNSLVAAVSGYVDHTMDRIGSELIGSHKQLSEALRRHRVETGESDRFVERLLGLELDRAQFERGASFAAGVVERAGVDGLRRLFEQPDNLPTPPEVDAPGLWLARIDLPH